MAEYKRWDYDKTGGEGSWWTWIAWKQTGLIDSEARGGSCSWGIGEGGQRWASFLLRC